MADFDSLAMQYAAEIRRAIRSDYARGDLEAIIRPGSATLRAIASVEREIRGLVYESNNQPLSREHVERLYKLISIDLDSPPSSFKSLTEAARNDDFSHLLDIIDQLVTDDDTDE